MSNKANTKMKIQTDSKLFAKTMYDDYLPFSVKEQKYVSKDTLMNILRIFGVFFVVLPEKNIGQMAEYVNKHSFGLVPVLVGKVLANFFVWLYPMMIIMLLITFLPITSVIVIVQNIKAPRTWFNKIRELDVLVARFLFGALFISISLRAVFELCILAHVTALDIQLYPVLYFVGYFTCIYPIVLMYQLLGWIIYEPLYFLLELFLRVFQYPISLVMLVLLSPFKRLTEFIYYYLSQALSSVGIALAAGWNAFIFIPTSLIYTVYTNQYIVLFVATVLIGFWILGRDHGVGILLPFKETLKGLFPFYPFQDTFTAKQQKPQKERQSEHEEECDRESTSLQTSDHDADTAQYQRHSESILQFGVSKCEEIFQHGQSSSRSKSSQSKPPRLRYVKDDGFELSSSCPVSPTSDSECLENQDGYNTAGLLSFSGTVASVERIPRNSSDTMTHLFTGKIRTEPCCKSMPTLLNPSPKEEKEEFSESVTIKNSESAIIKNCESFSTKEDDELVKRILDEKKKNNERLKNVDPVKEKGKTEKVSENTNIHSSVKNIHSSVKNIPIYPDDDPIDQDKEVSIPINPDNDRVNPDDDRTDQDKEVSIPTNPDNDRVNPDDDPIDQDEVASIKKWRQTDLFHNAHSVNVD